MLLMSACEKETQNQDDSSNQDDTLSFDEPTDLDIPDLGNDSFDGYDEDLII